MRVHFIERRGLTWFIYFVRNVKTVFSSFMSRMVMRSNLTSDLRTRRRSVPSASAGFHIPCSQEVRLPLLTQKACEAFSILPKMCVGVSPAPFSVRPLPRIGEGAPPSKLQWRPVVARPGDGQAASSSLARQPEASNLRFWCSRQVFLFFPVGTPGAIHTAPGLSLKFKKMLRTSVIYG